MVGIPNFFKQPAINWWGEQEIRFYANEFGLTIEEAVELLVKYVDNPKLEPGGQGEVFMIDTWDTRLKFYPNVGVSRDAAIEALRHLQAKLAKK
jgi:hypothetical protein